KNASRTNASASPAKSRTTGTRPRSSSTIRSNWFFRRTRRASAASRSIMRIRICSALALLAMVLTATGARAQSQLGSGSRRGVVTDPSNAIAAGAEVTVPHTATGAARRTTTSPSGQFEVPVLLVGDYVVRVAKTGFRTAEMQGLTVTVGSAATVRI